MPKYNLNDRLYYGSRDPRLAPDQVCFTGLNQRLGPKRPDPLVRATTGPVGAVKEQLRAGRRKKTMLPSGFDNA